MIGVAVGVVTLVLMGALSARIPGLVLGLASLGPGLALRRELGVTVSGAFVPSSHHHHKMTRFSGRGGGSIVRQQVIIIRERVCQMGGLIVFIHSVSC